MAKTSSLRAILAALIGNALIAICKFIASWMTLSSAMFSEAIHSVVDVGNQALLLFGLRISKRTPDKDHPFGYGKELYFWSLIVAILLFALGGGMALFKGISEWGHPKAVTAPMINYVVIGLAMVFEMAAWWVAYRALKERSNGRHIISSIHHAKDPALIVVLLEDSAALLGLLIALVGIYLNTQGMLRADSVASMLIGVMLTLVAVWLAYESKNLLIGEAAKPELVNKIRGIVRSDNRVRDAEQILTMHLGPDELLVNMYVDFIDNLLSRDVEVAIKELERNIKNDVPEAKYIFIAAKDFKSRF